MQKPASYKKTVLVYGVAFFAAQLVLAIIFYRERLFADSSYFVFQVINTGRFCILYQRFLLAACEVLPLMGVHLGCSVKTILILYSLNHVFFFFALFLFLVLKLNDVYGGMAVIAILLLNSLSLYTMPYLETWYASGLAIVLYSILKTNKQTTAAIALATLLEITILFSHPENFLLVTMILLLFVPYKRKAAGSLSGMKLNLRNPIFILVMFFIISAIYKFLTLDKYEGGQIGWALHSGNSSIPLSEWLNTSLIVLMQALGHYKIPILMLALAMLFYIKSRQLRRAGIVCLFFAAGVVIINFLWGEKNVTMYSSIHYIPLITIADLSFFYDAVPSYSGKAKYPALILLLAVFTLRGAEQVYAINPFTQSVENTERLIKVCDKSSGNKFFVMANARTSPYIGWTYPVETLLLSAEHGKNECRSLATDQDTAVVPATKIIFSDSSVFMLTRTELVTNKSLNPHYFYCAPGTYKTVTYSDCLPQVFFSHLNWNAQGKEWAIKHVEMFNGKLSAHFSGNEFGFGLTIPSDSLSSFCEEYYAKLTLARTELKANCSANALLICDVTDKNMHHKFYESLKLNTAPSVKDSNSKTYHYQFDIRAKKLNKFHISFYIWNIKKEDFYITDATVELFKVPPPMTF